MNWKSLIQAINNPWVAALITALITFLVWETRAHTWLLGFSFSLLLLACYRAQTNIQALAVAWCFFVVFDAMVLRWVFTASFDVQGWLLACVGLLIFSGMQALPLVLPVWAAKRWNRPAWLLGICVSMSVWAWFQSTNSLGFPWMNLSYQLGHSKLMSSALSRFGLMGTEALMWGLNGAVAWAIATKISTKRWNFGAIAVVLFLTVALSWSQGTMNDPVSDYKQSVLVAIPAYDPYEWDEELLYRHSRHVLAAIEYASRSGAAVVVFPEGYLKDFGDHPIYSNDLLLNPAIRDIHAACVEAEVEVVFGAIAKRVYEQSEPPSKVALREGEGRYSEKQNLVVHIDANGEITSRAKHHLVPFMEASAGAGFGIFSEALRLSLNRAGVSYASGSPPNVTSLNHKDWQILNCFESLFPMDWEFNRSEAYAMMVLANEGWTNKAMLMQHARMDAAVAKSKNAALVRSVSVHPDFQMSVADVKEIAVPRRGAAREERLVPTDFGHVIQVQF